jgi:DNA-binding GntR family transcriptional regulator
LTTLVQGEIERRVLEGELKAGDRINENALAAQLSISRGPIREACRALTEGGLLVSVVNRGFFVRKLTREEVVEVYDVRSSLMRLAGRELAARVTEDELAVLSGMVGRMDMAQAEGDFDAYFAENMVFHDSIIEFTRNQRLLSMTQGLVRELQQFRRHGLVQVGNLEVSNTEHKEILAALRERDIEAAGAAMEHHVLAAKERFLVAIGVGVD